MNITVCLSEIYICSRGRPAGELPEIRKRRSEIEIGANLCLLYRFGKRLISVR